LLAVDALSKMLGIHRPTSVHMEPFQTLKLRYNSKAQYNVKS